MCSRTLPGETDLIEAPKLSKDCRLYLKTENLQVTGSFKVRGAYNKISQLLQGGERKGRDRLLRRQPRTGRGSGRHPPGHPEHRLYAGRCPHYARWKTPSSLGAEVCLVPGTYDDAHDKAVELQAETGMTFIHPYDDEQVIAGQGTIGLEILDAAARCWMPSSCPWAAAA